MGRIAWNDGKYKKCKECKWLIGDKKSIGIQCMQPDNQKKWASNPRFAPDGYNATAPWKNPNTRACKRFEAIESEDE